MNFDFSANPRLRFGPGKINELPETAARYGNNLLLVTGRRSLQDSGRLGTLLQGFKDRSITVFTAPVAGEPSPELIDDITACHRPRNIQVVAAVGGGSVIDAGKALSAMLTQKEPVRNFLEGVGTFAHDGRKVPFIAAPTTAGTGSEATKNAVLTKTGAGGFKKSLRHDGFVPDVAIVDPELTRHCPPDVTAACGMDAVTQVLESLLSIKASWMTDALNYSALEVMGDSLVRLVNGSGQDLRLRSQMSYASYISGITLANAGLGVVHGFASVIGGMINIPHGVVCGTLVAEAMHQTLELLIKTDPMAPALSKAGKAARFMDRTFESCDPVEGGRHLVSVLRKWTDQLKIPGLSRYGFKEKDVPAVVAATGLKNNPVSLTPEAMSDI